MEAFNPQQRSARIPHGSVISYQVGFFFSIILTLIAFLLVYLHINSDHAMFSHQFLTVAIFDLAVVQLIVQAVFFLHLNTHSSARWNMIVFLFTGLVVFTVVAGSLWIMQNLNYRMTPEELHTYMNNQN
jgi:cytochrome o ubiquinol oxidase operon protein cyoD